MPFLPDMRPDAGPPTVYAARPDIWEPWSHMSQALMNGPSPFTAGERELLLAFAAGAAGCEFVCSTHAEAAYAHGVERGTVERLLEDESAADDRWQPLFAFVRILSVAPGDVTADHAKAVLGAGWGEDGFHDAVAIVARAGFMQRLVQGFGFNTPPPEVAASHAARRVERGYVNLYRAFRSQT